MRRFFSKAPTFFWYFLTLMLVYFIASRLENINYARKYYEKYENQQSQNVFVYIRTSQILDQTGNEEEIYTQLDEALNGHHFDFYFLRNQDKILRSNSLGPPIASLEQYSSIIHQLIANEKIIYANTKIGDNILTIGFYRLKEQFYEKLLSSNANNFFRNFLLVIVVAAAIGTFFFKEIYQIIAALKNPNRLGGTKIKTKSREADLLLRGLSLYEKQIDELAKENQSLNEHLLPALKHELSSGLEPPYSFNCTLVRTDINHFSTMFSQFEREKFMEQIHNFFILVSHLIARYGGYVYEFIGDEVIYYFKDEEHENSTITAVSCIRSINQEATQFSKHTKTELGCSWFIKSSVAYGSLRFGRLVSGHSLAGGTLIETVRILSHIHEKEVNTIYYGKKVAERIEPLCTSKLEQEVVLRGVSDDSYQLYSYQSHKMLSDLLTEAPMNTSRSFVGYYRSDADIVKMLQFLQLSEKEKEKEKEKEIDDALFFSLIKVFRSVNVTRSVHEIKNGYHLLLQTLLSEISSTEKTQSVLKRLTSLAGCADHLLVMEDLDPELNAIHRLLLDQNHPRLTATLVEQESIADSLDLTLSYKRFHKTGYGRLLANLLIRCGKIEITRRIFRELQFMLKHADPLFVASGLYAVGMVGAHYKAHNPIYLEAHRGFQNIIHKLPRFITHPHDSVSNQALQAIKRIKSDDQLGFLRTLYLATSDEKLKSKIDQHFDLSRYCASTPPRGQTRT